MRRTADSSLSNEAILREPQYEVHGDAIKRHRRCKLVSRSPQLEVSEILGAELG